MSFNLSVTAQELNAAVSKANAAAPQSTTYTKAEIDALLSHLVFDSSSKTYYLQQTQPANPQDGDIWIG